jgi:hypothetical protein
VGKTSLTIVEALSIATGMPLLDEEVHDQGNVWLINLEDPRSELNMRVLAAMKHYGLKKDDVYGKLFIDGEDDIKIVMAAEGRDGLVTNDALATYFQEKIISENITTVIVDPFVSVSLKSTKTAIPAFKSSWPCSGLSLATPIALSRSCITPEREMGRMRHVDSIRGAGSLIGAARTARIINKISVEDAMQLGFPEDQATGMFRVDDAKQNLAAATDKSLYRRIIGVQIANGEWIGVCISMKKPDHFDSITTKDAMRVQRVVGKQAESDPYRENVQSKQWVGVAIAQELGLDIDEQAVKTRVKAIVRTWVKTDVLRIDKVQDGRTGREVPAVFVGKWITGDEAGG